MMLQLVFLTFLSICVNLSHSQYGQGSDCCENYCYRIDEQPYLHFGTKTSYQIVYGKKSNQHIVPYCRPIKFWSLNRHGTRLPGKKAIARLQELEKIKEEIVKNYDERRSYPDRGRMCDDDLDLFRRWHWNSSITFDKANELTNSGAQELKFLARRYQTRFRELLNLPYSQQTYKFQYTNTDRTHDSYQAYIEGLFNNDAYNTHADVMNDDSLLKKYKSCSRWQEEVDDNPETLSEYYKFKQSQEYKDMVRDVFRRLGFKYVLNETLIEDMYDMCRYEKAWYVMRPSTWCAAFTKQQLKVIEYANDLIDYYRTGYGNNMNAQLGCPPLKDLYDRFEKTIRGDLFDEKVAVYFTHSATIQLFITAMGFMKDNTPLTAENYYTQTKRQWRTSMISPFSANLAAVLYECDQGDKHRVMFFLNENPVDYAGCEVGLCSWKVISEKLKSAADNCNTDFCENASDKNYISILSLALCLMLSIISITKSF